MSQSRFLPVLPLRNLVLFPGGVLPIDVGRPGSLRLLEDAASRSPARIAIATQKDPSNDDPGGDDLHEVGVEAEILKIVKLSDTRSTVVVRGLERVRFEDYGTGRPWLTAKVVPFAPEPQRNETEQAALEALGLSVRDAAKQLIELSPELSDEQATALSAVSEPARIGDLAAQAVDFTTDERLALLAEGDVHARLTKILLRVQHRLEVLRVKEKIDTQVRDELSHQQRDQVLRQKMKAIQEELGEADEGAEVSQLEEKIKAAGLTGEVLDAAKKQVSRLRGMQTGAAEYGVIRTYLDWLIELPWSKRTDDRLDLGEARRVLDADHFELDKVKRRLLEYLAVRRLAPNKKGPILCLVGPPGVGKTSLGKSIARALGREFVRISLGGMRDEAEIRGHRRTYIGALPGRIIQGMKRAGTKNPIMMLDEVDKVGADYRGDPSAALLEVLDPEQNNSFSDHYLEIPFDLSEVIFIATANTLDPIPSPLLDRMEVLELPGYTLGEKAQIAERFLLPKQLGEHGLSDKNLVVNRDALVEIAERYTREAGVRNLEREIASVVRGVAVKVASGDLSTTTLGAKDIEEYLGPQRYFSDVAERVEQPGIATGLAWTPSGGDILFIEATKMPGKGNLVLTGQLGAVMKESAQAAMSYVRAHTKQLGIPDDFLEKIDVHLHVPAGGTPKDGPSAGNALFAALVSLITGRRVRGDVAMTGEITLRGHVLPVGGIKEKLLAAHRAGIKRVLLPERNMKDLIDIPAEVRREMEILPVKRVEEVIALALEATAATDVPFEIPPALVQSALVARPIAARPQ